MSMDLETVQKELKETQDQLRVAKEQLRVQNRRARQLVAAFTVKLQDKEREMQMMRVLKDGQLQSIIRRLLHFESLLRQEQKKISCIVSEKDSVIEEQKKEIERLQRKLMMNSCKEESSEIPQHCAKVPKLHTIPNAEDKENKDHSRIAETPLVTKMVRKFEAPPKSPGKKPEVPKKPARIAHLKPRPPPVDKPAQDPAGNLTQVNPSADPKPVTISRKDSVNDHGYFTLEKRKPFKNGSGSVPQSKVEDETDLRQNFEEFHLDSLEEEHLYEATNETILEDQDRSCGDGAENKKIPGTPETQSGTGISNSILIPQLGDLTPNPAHFDRFLEMTGLTQKSILTPSRMLSNHKNMLKPKDVKHRSRVKAAVLGNCRLVEDDSNPLPTNQVRYYVEPFL